MPKKNYYKNMFKSASSSSLDPGQSSQAQAQPQAQASSSSTYQVSSRHTQSAQPVVSSSSSDGVSSQPVVPSSSTDGVSSQPTKYGVGDDEDNRDWLVDVIDEHQVIKTIRLKISGVHNLDNGSRIIIECDEYGTPIGKAGGLIAGVLGQLAINSLYFPIGFEKWPHMPKSFVNRVFDEILMPRFLFRTNQEIAKRWVDSNLNHKWRDHMHKLWKAAQKQLLSKEEMIKKHPDVIPADQWALFVNYRMKPKTQELCRKNQQTRQNQIPHTCGAKSLARRRDEMKAKGKEFDRGQMWTETHKKKDGNYVTDQAREIGEKIQQIRSQRPESRAEVSPNDALGIVLGPEHPGRVRGLGLGVVPTMAFKQKSRRVRVGRVGVDSITSSPTPEWQQEMTNMKSQLNALLSLYQRNVGNIPEEFAHLFPVPPQASNLGSGAQSPIEPRRSSDGSNNNHRPSAD